MVAMADTPAARELDSVTLLRARRGDRAAFTALVVFYQRPIFALLSRLLYGYGNDASLVEDLAQETFLRVHRALPDFDPNGAARLSTWILTIATRLGIDELRRRRPVVVPLQAAEAIHAPDRADAVAVRNQQRSAIEAAVAALSADHRATFLLREAHGLEYDEIARALDIDLGTVKSRLSRAKDQLRAALQSHAGENA